MTSSDASRLNPRNKTAMINGKEIDADKAAHIHETKEVFNKLSKGIKQILLYRHNKERYGEYLEDCFSALSDMLARRGQLTIKVTATQYFFEGQEVYVDESRDNNLCYPFYAHGIRLLIFNAGISPDELIRFINLTLSSNDQGLRQQEDFITRLWKAELQNIQYVVVEGFKVVEDESSEDVQMEVDKVVAYLYRQMQSNTDDVARFARVASEDLELRLQDVDQVRGNVIQGETATPADKDRIQRALTDEETNRLLPKMVVILFQLMELATDEKNFEDLNEAFSQLLDAMLLAERFDVITQILERFKLSKNKNLKDTVKMLVQMSEERFILKMGEAQRVNVITQVFNAGPLKDPVGMRNYLMQLGADAIPTLLDALERVDVAANRRILCDVLADIAKDYPDSIAARLNHPSSNVVKDMLYILDRIEPPNKLQLMATLLDHTNVVLRLETINTLGRNASDETLPYVIKCLKGQDSQMRAAAARVMHFFPADRAAQELLHQANNEDFGKRDRNEQRAILGSIAQVPHPKCQAYIQGVFAQKANLLNKAKVDAQKQLMIESLATNPGIQTLQLLAAVAQDAGQSKEIAALARTVALDMKNKLMGAGNTRQPA